MLRASADVWLRQKGALTRVHDSARRRMFWKSPLNHVAKKCVADALWTWGDLFCCTQHNMNRSIFLFLHIAHIAPTQSPPPRQTHFGQTQAQAYVFIYAESGG